MVGFGGVGDPRISPILHYHNYTEMSSFYKKIQLYSVYNGQRLNRLLRIRLPPLQASRLVVGPEHLADQYWLAQVAKAPAVPHDSNIATIMKRDARTDPYAMGR